VDPARDPGADARPALRRRLARRLRPPRTLRPTRAGWCFFAITFGVGFAALNTGNNLLYLVLSLMLAFLVLSGVLSEAALRGVRVRRRLPRSLHAGAPTGVALEITNAQTRAAAFAVVVEDHARDAEGPPRPAGRTFVLRAGPGETVVRSYRLTPARRGPLELTGFRVSTRFPFALFSKSLQIPARATALVYPAVEPLPVPPSHGGSGALDEGEGRPHAASGQVGGLRDWSPGDPARRIHWRASLRRGALAVRELEDEGAAEWEVRLRTAGPRPGEAFERSVSWAASEVDALLATGARVSLRTDHERLPAGAGERQRARLLAFLARVEPRADAPEKAA